MSTVNFNLRAIDQNVMTLLKERAKEKGISINRLIITCIEQNLGYSYTASKTIYHDLDHLSGTWTQAEVDEFKATTLDFERIDESIWS